ncbi:hypothetical protein [Streptomyces scabiei]|uniref:hypothetical protein n=1 Tax=Streptomyces scabiei TaxID=1930 RepID=UPI001B331A21|nr:hypothetical protein [Streptomyces sp. LBUM 1479]
MTLIAPAASPTVAVARALKRAGLEQGKAKDFQVMGRYRDQERKFTYVRVYGNQAAAVIAERADDIERWTSDAGFPFKVSVRYIGRHTLLVDVTNGPGERVREVPPAAEAPAAEESAATVDLTEAPSCPAGLYVVSLPSTRLHDWYGVECGRCVPGVRHGLPGEWSDRGDAILAARSHYELEHRSADEVLTPAELEELERWSLSSAQLRVLWWAWQGNLQEFVDGVWALDVSPDRADVNKRVARPRISGLWAAGLVGVYGLSSGGRQFVITDTGRRLHRLYFLAKRQGHELEGARDAKLPVLDGRERGYPFLCEGRYFVGEARPESEPEPETAPEPVVEPAAAPAPDAAEEPAVEAVPEPEPAVSYAEDYRQEQQAKALGWSTRHAEVVRWAAAGELRMETPDDLRRVTIPGRAGRRVAVALLRPLAAAAFITLGESDEEGRHRVEVTEDGRRALLVWDRKRPTPAVISRKQEGGELRPLLGGQEHRRRATEFEADLKRRAAEREAWYAAHDLRMAAEEREDRLRAVWAEVEGVWNPFTRRPAGWTPTPEQVEEFRILPELVAQLEEEAARLAAEAAAEPELTSTAAAPGQAVQEAPETSAARAAGRAPELPATFVRHGVTHHISSALTLQSHCVSIEVQGGHRARPGRNTSHAPHLRHRPASPHHHRPGPQDAPDRDARHRQRRVHRRLLRPPGRHPGGHHRPAHPRTAPPGLTHRPGRPHPGGPAPSLPTTTRRSHPWPPSPPPPRPPPSSAPPPGSWSASAPPPTVSSAATAPASSRPFTTWPTRRPARR